MKNTMVNGILTEDINDSFTKGRHFLLVSEIQFNVTLESEQRLMLSI